MEYNGWYNYETAAIHDFIFLDNYRSAYWAGRAVATAAKFGDRATLACFTLASEMKRDTTMAVVSPCLKALPAGPCTESIQETLLHAALAQVNWMEVARHLLNCVAETPAANKETPHGH
jgi:hypothetical protein